MSVLSSAASATALPASLFSRIAASRVELRTTPALRRASGPGVTEDEQLVERAKTGDREAFRALFVAHRQQVSRLVHRYVAAEEVEDVAQDVFLHVHRSLASFRGDSRFSTWLYRLTLNVARMHVRRQKSRPKLRLMGDDERGELEKPDHQTPAREADRNERARALYRLLARLSEKKREALVLHDLEGVTAEEISKLLEIPVMTVRTRVFYARKELYAALADEPSLSEFTSWLTSKEEP